MILVCLLIFLSNGLSHSLNLNGLTYSDENESINEASGVNRNKVNSRKARDLAQRVKKNQKINLEDDLDADKIQKSLEINEGRNPRIEGSIEVSLNLSGSKKSKALKRKKTSKQMSKKRQRLSREKNRRNLKLAKAVVALGKVVYKDVMPVVGALAISSGQMLEEKVVPAMKELSYQARAGAGRVADSTIKTVREYLPVVRKTLKSTMDSVVSGVTLARNSAQEAALEFQVRYAAALEKMEKKKEKELKMKKIVKVIKSINHTNKKIVPR